MPFRIDVLDAALPPERQTVLADVLVAHGVEREVADLVGAMAPGAVAEVESASARDRLIAALAAAGFAVRMEATGTEQPAVEYIPGPMLAARADLRDRSTATPESPPVGPVYPPVEDEAPHRPGPLLIEIVVGIPFLLILIYIVFQWLMQMLKSGA